MFRIEGKNWNKWKYRDKRKTAKYWKSFSIKLFYYK